VDILDLEDRYLIQVADNGIGIDEGDLPRIFERFYRVDKSRSRDVGGTGLGLAIAKHIIESHKQQIHATSIRGTGSTFSFTLEKSNNL
jgi:two-component system phosphate regulon sensor histidine kinase PhoR